MRRVVAASLLVAALAATARARSAERFVPGQPLFGTIGQDESVVLVFDAVGGTSFSAVLKPFKGTGVHLGITLADEAGEPIDLGAALKPATHGRAVRISKFRIPATASYRLTVSSADGTLGGFDLATSAAAPSKLHGTATFSAGGGATVDLDALPGDRVTLRTRSARRSPFSPRVVAFTDPAAAPVDFVPARATATVTYASVGTGRFGVQDAAGAAGDFKWTATIRRPKPPRKARDAAEVAALGTISGTVTYSGASAPTGVSAAAKRRTTRTAERRPDSITVPGSVIVDMRRAATWDEVADAAGAAWPGMSVRVEAALTRRGPYRVRIDELRGEPADLRRASHTEALAKVADASGRFEKCFGDRLRFTELAGTPSDPWFPYQYNLPQIRAPEAWDITTGDRSVVIAVIDTGIAPHPDVDPLVVPGFDFLSVFSSTWGDGDGWDADPTDTALPPSHGLAIAGVATARGNDRYGMAGVAWNASIQPIRTDAILAQVPGQRGVYTNGSLAQPFASSVSTAFDTAAAILWAAGLDVPGAPANPTPAAVINMSWAYTSNDLDSMTLIGGAINDVREQRPQCVLVAAAGNEPMAGLNPYPSIPRYPAAYPVVIGVYALNETLDLASYAHHGPWADVGAPGGELAGWGSLRGILTPVAGSGSSGSTGTGGGDFGWWAGSSFAAPHVAGVVALMRSARPDLTRDEVTEILQETAVDLGPPGFDDRFSHGLVDARAAVETAANFTKPAARVAALPPSLHFEGATTRLTSTVRSFPPSPIPLESVTVTTADGGAWLTAQTSATATPATFTVDVDPNLPLGRFRGTVTVKTGIGFVEIPVEVVRSNVVVPDKVIVSAIDAAGRRAARVTTDAAQGYAFVLEDLPPGDYRVEAMVDRDGSLAVDRVDEFAGHTGGMLGTGSIVVAPAALDVAGVVVAMERHDAAFSRLGTDGGPIAGALAVLAVDARTGVPVAGARVHLGTAGGAPAAVTDSRGRAVSVGAIGGPQTVTVVADGYWPTTHAGTDAQYFGVALEPAAPPAIRHVEVTVHGLAPEDHDVVVRIGDGVAHAVHASGDPVLGLDVTDLGVRLAVGASASDADGVPTKIALTDVGELPSALDVTVVPCAARSRVVGAALPAGMDPASATLAGVTFVRLPSGWSEVAASALVLGDYRDVRWPQIETTSSVWLTRLEVRAVDALGRRSTAIRRSTTGVTAWPPELVTLDAPASLVAPPDGSAQVDRPVRLSWSAAQAKPLRHIVLTRSDAPGRWDVWAGGAGAELDLPRRDDLMPASSTWRWTVEELGAPSLSDASYDRAQLDATLSLRTLSAPSTFTTR